MEYKLEQWVQIGFQQMHLIGRIFSHKKQPQKPSKAISIYLDNDLKRKLQTHNQTAAQYTTQNQFDPDQFLYLILKHKKNQQVYSKRKLNPYEWFTDALQDVPEQFKAYIVMGYASERNSFNRVSSSLPISDNPKCIRSGNLQIYSDSKTTFQQCHLSLHHDYLTYHKVKAKQKKVSFIPLENSIVETVSENRYVFIVKDKFKNIVFKTTSKQDMIGWLLAITQAIRIRSSQIYLNQFDEKLAKSIKDKMLAYQNKCISLKEQSKVILLDEIGRKALKNYFKKYSADEIDLKLLKIIENYLEMCRIRRQKGETHSQQLMNEIKQSIKSIFTSSQNIIIPRELSSHHQFIKVIEEIMKYLDAKYKKQVIDKKFLQATFQRHLTTEYKQKSRIPLKSLFGDVEINNAQKEEQGLKQPALSLNLSFRSFSSSPSKKLNRKLN